VVNVPKPFAKIVVTAILTGVGALASADPLAEKRGLAIQTSGDMTPTIGSHALLLQLTTNLVHNAIVHNLPERGIVWVTTSVHPKSAVLTVENTGEKLTPQLVSTLAERFFAAANACAPTTQVSASASPSSKASPRHTTEP
jgi:signal transduction histidine kinase